MLEDLTLKLLALGLQGYTDVFIQIVNQLIEADEITEAAAGDAVAFVEEIKADTMSSEGVDVQAFAAAFLERVQTPA